MSTLSAAIINNIILSQKTVSLPRAVALVINSRNPEGIISHNPLLDQGSKWRDKAGIGKSLDEPRRRRSNINAAPTTMVIPIMCVISKAGYNHNDCLMVSARAVFSNQSSKSDI